MQTKMPLDIKMLSYMAAVLKCWYDIVYHMYTKPTVLSCQDLCYLSPS